MSAHDLPPNPTDHPRRLAEAAVHRFGRDVVVAWCEELLAGSASTTDSRWPPIEWLGNRQFGPTYWGRTWGARGLLHVGPPARPQTVVGALADEHWRVREMALKVVARHAIDVPEGVLEALLDDPVARVRTQARRCLTLGR